MTTPYNTSGAPVERAPLIEAEPTIRTSGGLPVTTRLVLTNVAPAPRILSLSAHGVDTSWLPRPSRSGVLQPGESVAVDLTFQPAAGTIPASYPLAIAVQALDPANESPTSAVSLAEIRLTVDAPGQITVRLDPTETTAIFSKKVDLVIENNGPLGASVDLETEAAHGMRVELPTKRVNVAAGQLLVLRAKVRPQHARLFGGRVRRAYSVTGRSKGAPRTADGMFVSKAFLGPTAATVTVIACVLALWLGAVVVLVPKLSDRVKQNTLDKAASKITQTQTATASGSPAPSGSGGASGSASDQAGYAGHSRAAAGLAMADRARPTARRRCR